MNRIAILALSVTILFTLAGCNSVSKNSSEHDSDQTQIAGRDGCAEHSSEAAFSRWRECTICEAMRGEYFSTQCDTWSDVVALAGFGEYSYELSVSDFENIVSITLTFSDAEQFADNDWVSYFMRDSYLAFVGISWFTQGESNVVTPDKFQNYFVIKLDFPGGTIVCLPDDYNRVSSIGILTSLFVDEDSPNKFMVERLYNLFFKSVTEAN